MNQHRPALAHNQPDTKGLLIHEVNQHRYCMCLVIHTNVSIKIAHGSFAVTIHDNWQWRLHSQAFQCGYWMMWLDLASC